MGSSKFRISDMMPNSWFYKLKNMGKGRTSAPAGPKRQRQPKSAAPIDPINSKLTKQPHQQQQSNHRNLSAPQARKSYHFSRQEGICAANSPRPSQSNYPDPPRKSTRRKSTGRSRRMSFLASGRRVPSPKPDLTTPEYSISTSPFDSSPETRIGGPLPQEFRSDAILPTESSVSWSSTCSCGASANSAPNDNDVDAKSFNSKFDVISELDLAPIVTKPGTKKTGDFKNRSPGRRTLAGHYSPGMRLRLNSPKIASRRIQALSVGRRSVSSLTTTASCSVRRRRRTVSDSFAVVKASNDPTSDFRDSMVEMIMQNNIWDSKDLEELLACYLSLNSDEYHGVIISVFKQIWHDLTGH